jgi:hypothetical protein
MPDGLGGTPAAVKDRSDRHTLPRDCCQAVPEHRCFFFIGGTSARTSPSPVGTLVGPGTGSPIGTGVTTAAFDPPAHPRRPRPPARHARVRRPAGSGPPRGPRRPLLPRARGAAGRRGGESGPWPGWKPGRTRGGWGGAARAGSAGMALVVGRAAVADRNGPDRVGMRAVGGGPGSASSSTRPAAVHQAARAAGSPVTQGTGRHGGRGDRTKKRDGPGRMPPSGPSRVHPCHEGLNYDRVR